MPKPMSELVEDLQESLGLVRTAHERCPDGTHWNEDKRKCMKVSGALRQYTKTAHERSKESEKESNTVTHSKAEVMHGLAKDELRKKGFHELADVHDAKAKEHRAKAKALATYRQ